MAAAATRWGSAHANEKPRLRSRRSRGFLFELCGRLWGSALHHRDVDAADLALGRDLHRLLVSTGEERQGGGKAVGFDEHLDLAATGGALQISEDVAALLAPVSGDAITVRSDFAREIEFVAVARALQLLLQPHAGAVDLVGGLAVDALRRTVGQRNRAVARPSAVEPGKWRAGLGLASRH